MLESFDLVLYFIGKKRNLFQIRTAKSFVATTFQTKLFEFPLLLENFLERIKTQNGS